MAASDATDPTGLMLVQAKFENGEPCPGLRLMWQHMDAIHDNPAVAGVTDAAGTASITVGTADALLSVDQTRFIVLHSQGLDPDRIPLEVRRLEITVAPLLVAAVKLTGDDIVTFNLTTRGLSRQSSSAAQVVEVMRRLRALHATDLLTAGIPGRGQPTAEWKILLRRGGWIDVKEALVPLSDDFAPRLLDCASLVPAAHGSVTLSPDPHYAGVLPEASLHQGVGNPPDAIIPVRFGEVLVLPPGHYRLKFKDKLLDEQVRPRSIQVEAGQHAVVNVGFAQEIGGVRLALTVGGNSLRYGRLHLRKDGKLVQDRFFDKPGDVMAFAPPGHYDYMIMGAEAQPLHGDLTIPSGFSTRVRLDLKPLK